jgi:RNA polymerase sigma factor (sigma-70 family)
LRDISKSFRKTKKRSIDREQRLKSDAVVPLEKPFLTPMEFQEYSDALSQAMSALPKAHQQILHWLYYDQMSFPQIAAIVGRSDDAVRMLVNRAIQRLAREMRIHDFSSQT